MSWDGHPRRRVITADEARIWRAITLDVKPLAGRSLPPPPAEADPIPQAMERTEPHGRLPHRPSSPPPPISAPRQLPQLSHGHLPAVDKRSAERLKRGEMIIDSRLDLHGMTQDAAHSALSTFVRRGYDHGRRCLLVITGKGLRDGSGILRHQVPRWLNHPPLRDLILGYSHARPQHGGDGALYLLIRRKR